MKQGFKIIVLILVFVLPVGIFVFLKLFGRNEFDVAPLFVSEAPPQSEGCNSNPTLPYFVPDSVQRFYNLPADSLTVIFFGPLSGEGHNQVDRVRELTTMDPVRIIESPIADSEVSDKQSMREKKPGTEASNHAADSLGLTARREADYKSLKRCVFFLDGATNVVMLDRRGAIRGQYTAADRDEMDRLLTEITIILKKY